MIFYSRPDKPGPKESFYLRSPIANPETLRRALSEAYGEIGRVRKCRTLFEIGRSRIHLDQVDELGDFLEIEVVLTDEEDAEAGVLEAQQIMSQLRIDSGQLVEAAYIDLLSAESRRSFSDTRFRGT